MGNKAEFYLSKENGTVKIWWLFKWFVTQSCNMTFDNFPFDTQECTFLVNNLFPKDVVEFDPNEVSYATKFQYIQKVLAH